MDFIDLIYDEGNCHLWVRLTSGESNTDSHQGDADADLLEQIQEGLLQGCVFFSATMKTMLIFNQF